MELTVSSSLDGRDLAVVKSLINIQNIFGELNLTYVESHKAATILIAKDYLDSGAVYYALNRHTGQKYLIEPDLNPQSVRALFETLAEEEKSRVTADHTSTEIITTRDFIRDHAKNHHSSQLWICTEEFSLVVVESEHKVYATEDLSYELISQFSQLSLADVKFKHAHQAIPNQFIHSTQLETFKWIMGLSLSNSLLNKKYHSSEYAFKQVSWPDYGSYPFKNEFIKLSSLLWKRSETYDELKQHSGLSDDIIHQFLNAALMAGHVLVTSVSVVAAKPKAVKKSKFLMQLRKLFSFTNHSTV